MWPPARGEGSGASWKYSRSSQPTAKLPNELRSAWLSLVASDPDETLAEMIVPKTVFVVGLRPSFRDLRQTSWSLLQMILHGNTVGRQYSFVILVGLLQPTGRWFFAILTGRWLSVTVGCPKSATSSGEC